MANSNRWAVPRPGEITAAISDRPVSNPPAVRRSAPVPEGRAQRFWHFGRAIGEMAVGAAAEGLGRLARGQRIDLTQLMLTPDNARRHVRTEISTLRRKGKPYWFCRRHTDIVHAYSRSRNLMPWNPCQGSTIGFLSVPNLLEFLEQRGPIAAVRLSFQFLFFLQCFLYRVRCRAF